MRPNVKLTAACAAAILSSFAFAQGGPPPGGQGQGPASRSSRSSFGQNANSQQNSNIEVPTTIQLLSRSDVDQQLGLTVSQYASLSNLAKTFKGVETSEDTAFSSVSQYLSTTQVTQLTALLVQSLGYRSMQVTAVQSKLSLTADQQTKISEIFTLYLQAARHIRHSAATATVMDSSIAEIKKQTDDLLAKVLTSDQDKALRALAVVTTTTQTSSGD